METGFTASSERLRWLMIGALLAVGLWLVAWLPIAGTEAYGFVHFVRPPLRDLLGGFDPANHVLNTVLMKRAVGVLRLSAFSLRVPAILGLALFLWAVAGLVSGWRRGGLAAIALAGAAYLGMEYVAPASALGLALALWTCAAQFAMAYLEGNQRDELRNLNLVGICLGLSMAANFGFLIPSMALALVLLLATRRWIPWVERVMVTAAVSAFLFLVLPFSHASARQLVALALRPPRLSLRAPEDLTGLIATLRTQTRGKTVRIAASADLVPVLEFYQARFREGGWRIVEVPGPADYYVLDRPAVQAPFRTVYRGRMVVLAR